MYANNLTVDNLTLSGNITVQGLNLTARPGKVIYVATNGDDSNSGTHQNDPYASIEQALAVAIAGDPFTYIQELIQKHFLLMFQLVYQSEVMD